MLILSRRATGMRLSFAHCSTTLPREAAPRQTWYHAHRAIMSASRVLAYLGTGVLALAWRSSAAGVGERQAPAPTVAPRPVQTGGTETLANEVLAHAARLRERLSAAPAPQSPHRN